MIAFTQMRLKENQWPVIAANDKISSVKTCIISGILATTIAFNRMHNKTVAGFVTLTMNRFNRKLLVVNLWQL